MTCSAGGIHHCGFSLKFDITVLPLVVLVEYSTMGYNLTTSLSEAYASMGAFVVDWPLGVSFLDNQLTCCCPQF
jgi:hypothetical protein